MWIAICVLAVMSSTLRCVHCIYSLSNMKYYSYHVNDTDINFGAIFPITSYRCVLLHTSYIHIYIYIWYIYIYDIYQPVSLHAPPARFYLLNYLLNITYIQLTLPPVQYPSYTIVPILPSVLQYQLHISKIAENSFI